MKNLFWKKSIGWIYIHQIQDLTDTSSSTPVSKHTLDWATIYFKVSSSSLKKNEKYIFFFDTLRFKN